MRNGYKLAAVILVTLVVGCANKGKKAPKAAAMPQKAVLDAGYAALEAQQYNEAIAKADEFLAKAQYGPGSAEALYLKGRGLEGKTAADADEAKRNLADARAAYIQALERRPPRPLESYVRTSLANVAYFQDDYPTAISQWMNAYEKLDRDDLKAWALYRVGVSQQRQGQFELADRTFNQVIQSHPNTMPAARAQERRGARAFFVQVATFANASTADKTVAELKKQGVGSLKSVDGQGHTVVRIGPIASYSQAQYMKTRFSGKYPDAIVIP
jgi:tetratricopeptide (TPR) repeat protein